MNFGTLTRHLARKVTNGIAGDAAAEVTISYLAGQPVYDPVTGAVTSVEENHVFKKVLLGGLSDNEIARYKMAESDRKVVIDGVAFTLKGIAYPTSDDKVIVNGVKWNIRAVKEDMTQAFVIIYICGALAAV